MGSPKKELKERHSITLSIEASKMINDAADRNSRSFSSQVEAWAKDCAKREQKHLKKN